MLVPHDAQHHEAACLRTVRHIPGFSETDSTSDGHGLCRLGWAQASKMTGPAVHEARCSHLGFISHVFVAVFKACLTQPLLTRVAFTVPFPVQGCKGILAHSRNTR
jgi:hypothetical protein